MLCSMERHFNLTVPLSTQVYKWVPAICWGKSNKLWGSDGLASHPGEVEILLAATETGISFGSYEPVLAPRLHSQATVYIQGTDSLSDL